MSNVPRQTYREWKIDCIDCGINGKWAWSDKLDMACPLCKKPAELYYDYVNQAPGVIGDSIPGGMVINHGIVGPDGRPRRVDSRTDLKRYANEAGVTIKGDTPKPYRVAWSGRVRED